jgi:PAS domain S-box-containing protein
VLQVEELCRRIVEDAQDGIIFADSKGTIQLWNIGAARIFGHSAEDVAGKSMDIIIPENLRERHWSGYRKVMETGESRYGSELLSVPALRAGGSRISVEFTIVPVKDKGGPILGVAAIIREVTRRREEEMALKQQVSELRDRLHES